MIAAAILSAVLAYHTNWIRRRHAVLRAIAEDDGRHFAVGDTGEQYVPWRLAILGDREGMSSIMTNLPETDPLMREFVAVFPEVHVSRGGRWKHNGVWIRP